MASDVAKEQGESAVRDGTRDRMFGCWKWELRRVVNVEGVDGDVAGCGKLKGCSRG